MRLFEIVSRRLRAHPSCRASLGTLWGTNSNASDLVQEEEIHVLTSRLTDGYNFRLFKRQWWRKSFFNQKTVALIHKSDLRPRKTTLSSKPVLRVNERAHGSAHDDARFVVRGVEDQETDIVMFDVPMESKRGRETHPSSIGAWELTHQGPRLSERLESQQDRKKDYSFLLRSHPQRLQNVFCSLVLAPSSRNERQGAIFDSCFTMMAPSWCLKENVEETQWKELSVFMSTVRSWEGDRRVHDCPSQNNRGSQHRILWCCRALSLWRHGQNILWRRCFHCLGVRRVHLNSPTDDTYFDLTKLWRGISNGVWSLVECLRLETESLEYTIAFMCDSKMILTGLMRKRSIMFLQEQRLSF